MGALFGLLTIIVLSIVIIRIGAVAFELTGLSPDVAAFQSQSAFSGTGFTTSESESVVSHPLRRRIARILILLGSAGFTSSIATLILTFTGLTGKVAFFRIIILSIGILLIYLFARSKLIFNGMKRLIMKALQRYSSLTIIDYHEILGLQKGYLISRFKVKPNSWLTGCTLRDLDLHQEGITILSITRFVNGKEKFIGVPTADTVIQEGDLLVCYGRKEASKSLSKRSKGKSGDAEHQKERQKEEKAYEKRLKQAGYS